MIFRLGNEYYNTESDVTYILISVNIDEEWIELYNGTREELDNSNFREIWAGSIDEFKEQWKIS